MSKSGLEGSASNWVENDLERRAKGADPQRSASACDDLLLTSDRPPMSPRKRKSSTPVERSRSRVKQLRPIHRDEYRKLYNEEIANFIGGSANDKNKEEAFKTSQLGFSVWNASEKSTFFRSLERRGRHDLRGISNSVRSKSEPEIFQYINLLQKSFAEESSRISPPILLQRPLEAAFELSLECTEALDRCADALSALQQREEETNEIAKHGDMWLLIPSIARWTEECIKDDGKRAELVASLPEAELLNLKSFLDLSNTFFMNSSDIEYNWRSYIEDGPTMMNTAFKDFHTLAVILTKKIIKSAVFVALFRIRETGSSCYEVRRKDVSAALGILGITSGLKDYWTGLARRCNLRVYNEVVESKTPKKEYSYDEVEDLLVLKRDDYMAASRSCGRSELESEELPNLGSDALSESRSASPMETAPKASLSRSSSPMSATDSDAIITNTRRSASISDSELLQIQRDSNLDKCDLKESAQEELRLYALLDLQHAKTNSVSGDSDKDTEDIEIAQDSSDILRLPENQDDWTSWIDYRAEWENPAGLVPQWKFGCNDERRGRRREREDLTDEEPNDVADGLKNKSEHMRKTSSAADTESDIRSSRVHGPSQSTLKRRGREVSEESESDGAIDNEDINVSPASRLSSGLSEEYSIEEEREAEETWEDEEEEDSAEEEEDDEV